MIRNSPCDPDNHDLFTLRKISNLSSPNFPSTKCLKTKLYPIITKSEPQTKTFNHIKIYKFGEDQ